MNKQQNPKLFDKDVETAPTRQGYGEGLVEAGEADGRVVVLCADLTESTKSDLFKKKFPDRFVEVGVAEQCLATVAAGMANYGKIPFISSYAAFSPGRNWEQIRTTIALNDLPVKIAGAHGGLTVGPDGATHQALEDLATMRVMPNMTVVYPCDAIEARKATVAAAKTDHPVYLRLAREKTPVITTNAAPFEIGKAEILANHGNDVAIIACGPLVYQSLVAAKELAEIGIKAVVVNCHTLKPLDKPTLLKVARDCGAVVTVEEHQVHGGLGGAIAELLSQNLPTPIEFVGMPDSFGESGQPEELLAKYKMDAPAIVAAAKRTMERKTN
ncbi:MAG: transketolase C-terminal domain-containing protein [bacterium]|nr:transketolase C-terminal domain-containing protein [bacterium]